MFLCAITQCALYDVWPLRLVLYTVRYTIAHSKLHLVSGCSILTVSVSIIRRLISGELVMVLHMAFLANPFFPPNTG